MKLEDLENRFSYSAPKDEETKQKHETVRNTCLRVAVDFNNIIPEGREKALVMTHLEQVMMWANAAIAREKKEEDA